MSVSINIQHSKMCSFTAKLTITQHNNSLKFHCFNW